MASSYMTCRICDILSWSFRPTRARSRADPGRSETASFSSLAGGCDDALPSRAEDTCDCALDVSALAVARAGESESVLNGTSFLSLSQTRRSSSFRSLKYSARARASSSARSSGFRSGTGGRCFLRLSGDLRGLSLAEPGLDPPRTTAVRSTGCPRPNKTLSSALCCFRLFIRAKRSSKYWIRAISSSFSRAAAASALLKDG